ncbi:hypothetical protein O988_01096 [Pseudogymnoascus sp. VKM F-3808]|nr:hypothetical protein O988_01096 [Pseudogymnoascus sp. VKM F-3808]
MPPSLDGLPNEIISAILIETDRAALAALCHVSRYFYSLVTPSLYRVIQHHENAPHDPRRVPLLLRSLLGNPALGGHIVEVQFSLPGPEYEDVGCFSEEEWVLVRGLVAKLYETGLLTEELFSMNILHTTEVPKGIASEVSWNKSVREGHWDAIFSLILYCCSGVEKLRGFQWNRWDAPGHSYPGFYFLGFFMSAVALSKTPEYLHAQKPSAVPILPNYRGAHLSNKTGSDDRPILLQSLLPFLYSSSIELDRVNAKIEGGPTQRHRLWGRWRFCLKKIVIKQSTMTADTLRYLLASCDALEEFVLEHGTEEGDYSVPSGNMQRMVYDQGPLVGGLQRSKKSLTRLELARGFEYLYNRKLADIEQTLGSLVEFEVLTHLAVNLEFLIWQKKPNGKSTLCGILPRSLESLFIATEDVPKSDSPDSDFSHAVVLWNENLLFRNIHHFEELVLRKEDFVPNLRHIVLDGIQLEEADNSVLRALKRACKTYNVQLSIVLYGDYLIRPGVWEHGSETVSF